MRILLQKMDERSPMGIPTSSSSATLLQAADEGKLKLDYLELGVKQTAPKTTYQDVAGCCTGYLTVASRSKGGVSHLLADASSGVFGPKSPKTLGKSGGSDGTRTRNNQIDSLGL